MVRGDDRLPRRDRPGRARRSPAGGRGRRPGSPGGASRASSRDGGQVAAERRRRAPWRGRPGGGAGGAGRTRTRPGPGRSGWSGRGRSPAEDQLVDDPVGASRRRGARSGASANARDLLDLVVVARGWRRAAPGTCARCGPARTSRTGRRSRAVGDVLVEVVGEEEHRPAEGRELEHDRRVVGDEQVDREEQVVDVDAGVRSPSRRRSRYALRDRERSVCTNGCILMMTTASCSTQSAWSAA